MALPVLRWNTSLNALYNHKPNGGEAQQHKKLRHTVIVQFASSICKYLATSIETVEMDNELWWSVRKMMHSRAGWFEEERQYFYCKTLQDPETVPWYFKAYYQTSTVINFKALTKGFSPWRSPKGVSWSTTRLHSGCSSRSGARDRWGEEAGDAQELFFGYVRWETHEMEGPRQPRRLCSTSAMFRCRSVDMSCQPPNRKMLGTLHDELQKLGVDTVVQALNFEPRSCCCPLCFAFVPG